MNVSQVKRLVNILVKIKITDIKMYLKVLKGTTELNSAFCITFKINKKF